jgi:hypothetical protein
MRLRGHRETDVFANTGRLADNLRHGVHPRHDLSPQRLRRGERRVCRDGGVHFAEGLNEVSRRECLARVRKVQKFLK